MQPSLTKVVLSRDVLHTCLCHALSTEHQEIMGLLIGQIIQSEAHISRSLVLSRRDKQKDRVEVGYEHLAAASTIAERLSEVELSQQNVIGWYHSRKWNILIYIHFLNSKYTCTMYFISFLFIIFHAHFLFVMKVI